MNPDRLPSPQNKNRFVTEQAGAPTNGSGFEPMHTKVLVLPDEVAAKSAGGIHLPQSVKEQNDFAVCTGVVVAVGPAAFTNWPHSLDKWAGAVEAGERIVLAKYAGLVIEGKTDGRKYRLIQDTDVIGKEIA